jgi:hypothetical protein
MATENEQPLILKCEICNNEYTAINSVEEMVEDAIERLGETIDPVLVCEQCYNAIMKGQ